MKETLTYLHMTGVQQHLPAPTVEGLLLVRSFDPARVRALHSAIGAPHLWSRCTWTNMQWDRWLSDERHTQWLLTFQGNTVGALELDHGPTGSVEVVVFGLLADHVGKGLGGYALTLATQAAWNTPYTAGDSPKRVWLFTSSLDHPRALSNYLRRGYSIVRTDTRNRPDAAPLAAPDRRNVAS
nr:GNAT family N-acetyltransferase [Streptomyces chartreusis]